MKLLLLPIVMLLSVRLFAADEAAAPAPPARARADLMQRSRTIGGEKGNVFAVVREDGALLTGFAFHVGNYEGNTVVQAVQPIFTSADGKVRGPMLGTPVGAEIAVEARDGYAVAGLTGKGGHVLDGLEVSFMRIKDGRAALDAADAYASDWVGGPGGEAETQIGCDGRPVVGIFGQAGVNFNALGVVQAQPAFFDPAARTTAPAAAPPRGPAGIRLRRAYELALREELEQTNTRRFGARAAYLLALDRYAAQLHSPADDETATHLDAMRVHYRGHEAIGMSLPDKAPAAWRKLHRAFIAELDKTRLERETNIERPFSNYLAQLQAEIVRLEKAGDKAVADELRASFRAHPAEALTRGGVERTAIAGHQTGTPFLDLGEKGALLVGFEYRDGGGFIGMIQPVYRTKDGTSVGDSYGRSRGEAIRIEAGEGYAVGAINVKNGNHVDGFDIVFMRVKAGGAALDKTDTYKSEWCGGTGGGGPRTLGGDGRPVLGICGRSGAEIDGLGLVQKARPAQ